jgi:cytochrome P450
MTQAAIAKSLPPGPDEGFDILAADDPLEVLGAEFRTYGDIFTVHSPARDRHTVVVIHPDYVKRVLVDNRHNYQKGTGFDRVKMLLGNSIIASDGDFWKSNRLMIQSAFHKSLIQGYVHQFTEITESLASQWKQSADAGETVDVTKDTSELTLLNVLKSLFSEDLEGFEVEEGRNPFMLVTDDSARDLLFARKFRGLAKLVIELVHRRREENLQRHDILAAVMTARDRKTGEPMADRQLADEILTLIVAGHETTAGTLNWTWYLLSRHAQVDERLGRELHEVLGDGPPTVDSLSKLVYTRQVLEESMRLYPPGWAFTRRAIEDDAIGGYHVPAGSDILVCPFITHRHPDFWDDVERFDPDRFDPARGPVRHKYAYLPFSAGPRRCIGDGLAMVEMLLHMATVARTLRMECPSDEKIELEAEINLRSKQNIHLLPIRR